MSKLWVHYLIREENKTNRKTKELNRINNALDQQINAENQEAFIDMLCYLQGTKISEYHQELVRQDLTEMVLSAQKRGENIRETIGEDYKGFCDNVIASLPSKTRGQKTITFFDTLCWSLSILGLINIVFSNETIALIRNAVAGKPLNFSIPISLETLIATGMILTAAFAIVKIIVKNSFQICKDKKEHRTKTFSIIAGLAGVGITAALLAIFVWLTRVTLFTVNLWIACLIVLALYVVHKILDSI
ncbi:hypothetical protein LB941_01765 [Ligilactobacillus sp. WILCCON 0076]|uniref:DUF1129 family protein n=1 Tax=Ligilactobacillus ubinensis TaxID=2876789 RepID=A0A9X2FH57_9LACO|nr:hypothetical protein [Ligilactobacillus ubinensis]MCP0886061.1 hypothetical protein [Ligilactobacillus ubinensis]